MSDPIASGLSPELQGWKLELQKSLKIAYEATLEVLPGDMAGGDARLIAAAVLVGARIVERAVDSLREDVTSKLGHIDTDLENLRGSR